ncbi:RagB/SusD family nutrient uptake outer membrane protein [Parabacteroides sp. PF5-6]|uniref:RagB/SusD family nutrient uptake outer membrane protein n=1 Tax=Parabacteroides sp. PF5-6 TaxID=1742403 RepID=UPI002406B209|nr:RagB/SusD family nutrient uptake outer membrane protein [Parabacteroides sp. PF5-6]MDF9831145.1 hypothetical protein [Parabacteroides sp. PF5-6]
MNRLFSIVAAIGMLSLATACTDILDTAPYNRPASSTMWGTENLTDMGVAGIYSNLRGWGYAGDGAGYGLYALDQWGVTSQRRDNEPFMNGTATTSQGLFSNFWKKAYEGIHRANDAIKNIPEVSPVSAEKKGRLVAEAKFLRALHYYKLNELFKGVPVYLEPITPDECTLGQSSENEVWEQIAKDLTDCINEPNFPNIDLKEGRATKGAAYALRGKVYMHQQKWDQAAADFAKVGECGYALFQDGYKELFTEANERCEEMIFSVQHIGDAGFGGNSQFYCGTRSSFGSCWNTFLVAPSFVDMYEYADGKAFNWDDIIPGFNAMDPKAREVYFLRNIEGASATVTDAVQKRLDALGDAAKAVYLPAGNEERIKKAYENRDPRLAASVITPYSTYLGIFGTNEILTTSTWPMADQAGGDLWTDSRTQFHYLHRKFVYEGNNPIPARDRCPTDEPMIRYADVLLLWAEALVEQGKLTEAAEKVNMVRGRASVGMPPVQYTGQDDLREKVRHERRIEFVNEGINFFDEMRWKTLKETKFKAGNGITQVWGAVVSPYTWQGDYKYTWPIPAKEVEMNPNLTPTPGWIY